MRTALVWLRRELRLADNPALREALTRYERIVPCFVFDPDGDEPWPPGSAHCVWLHYSLRALAANLEALGSRLIIRRGDSARALTTLAETTGAGTVLFNRLYEPASLAQQTHVAESLQRAGVLTQSYNAALLVEPWDIATRQGGPYKVFTPFWRSLSPRTMAAPAPAPARMPAVDPAIESEAIETLPLLPEHRWHRAVSAAWQPGERGAKRALEAFTKADLAAYAQGRDLLAGPGTSLLSPHLHFGEVSPRQIWEAVTDQQRTDDIAALADGPEAFLRQLGWREFAHHVLYHFPHTPESPLDARFEAFPWAREYSEPLKAWQHGRTGIPVIDAAMRQLWITGWMHNRMRMTVASFLTKNLLIPWQEGARWFWDTLVDGDLANNTLGWQWAAGCGADAAPYFRVFNPVRQGQRFDPAGAYVRQWLPELSALPDRYIHTPWEAPATELTRAGLELDRDYPRPLVDLKRSREAALAAYQRLRKQNAQ